MTNIKNVENLFSKNTGDKWLYCASIPNNEVALLTSDEIDKVVNTPITREHISAVFKITKSYNLVSSEKFLYPHIFSYLLENPGALPDDDYRLINTLGL